LTPKYLTLVARTQTSLPLARPIAFDAYRAGYGSAALLGFVVQPLKQEQQRVGVDHAPPPHITETPVRHPQGRYQASSRDLGVSQPPQGVDQLTHPLDTAGEAVSGDPALRRAQTRQIALNFRNFRNLEVTSDAVRPVMAVYWGCEAMTLIVCHDCTCVAAGSPVMHSFCGLLGPGTSPKCA